MLRSAQMLMAQALILHKLGRQWRSSSQDINNPYPPSSNNKEEDLHRSIIKLFSDTDTRSPFSIHNLVRIGSTLGKTAGNWFGPATAAFLLQMAWLNNSQTLEEERDSILKDLAVYVSQDCTVYKQDVINICSGGQTSTIEQEGFDMMTTEQLDYSYSEEVTVDSESWCLENQIKIEQADPDPWKSVLILVPIRVGGDKVNPIYEDCLRNLLTLPCCVGWIGGKPSHSLYFIGYQDEYLLHLDPHRIQPPVDTNQPEFPVNTFHCHNPRKLLISKMDPSSCLGFYLRTRDELEVWCSEIESYVTPQINKTSPNKTSRKCEKTLNYPLFTVQHKNTEVTTSEEFTSLEFSSSNNRGATEWVNMEMTQESKDTDSSDLNLRGAENSGLNPSAAENSSSNPSAAESLGSNPSAAESLGSNPSGAESLGSNLRENKQNESEEFIFL